MGNINIFNVVADANIYSLQLTNYLKQFSADASEALIFGEIKAYMFGRLPFLRFLFIAKILLCLTSVVIFPC